MVDNNVHVLHQDGIIKEWHNNGKSPLEANFKDGKQDGLYKEWHEGGQLKKEGKWKNGKMKKKNCWDEDGNEIKCN